MFCYCTVRGRNGCSAERISCWVTTRRGCSGEELISLCTADLPGILITIFHLIMVYERKATYIYISNSSKCGCYTSHSCWRIDSNYPHVKICCSECSVISVPFLSCQALSCELLHFSCGLFRANTNMPIIWQQKPQTFSSCNSSPLAAVQQCVMGDTETHLGAVRGKRRDFHEKMYHRICSGSFSSA